MERPSFLFLVGEDAGRLMGCYGHQPSVARDTTPRLDALGARGCVFEQAWATAPVCAPSRFSLVTGRHPQRHAAHPMRSRALHPPPMFTESLLAAGYEVRWPGKTDFNFDPDATGRPWCSSREPWVNELRDGRLGRDRPFFAYRNFEVTHESGMWAADPPAGAPADRPRGAPWEEEPEPHVRHRPEDVEVPPYLPDTPGVRADVAAHADNLATLDARIGEVLDALDASGRGDGTYVVFLADHGRGLMREKRWCYPAGVRIPLLVAGPGVEPGSRSGRLVSGTDLAPTVLGLAVVSLPEDPPSEGEAFLAPGGQPAAGRAFAFFGRDRMDESFDRVRGVTDGRFLLLRNDFPGIPYAQRTRYMEHMRTTQAARSLGEEGPVVTDDPRPERAVLRHPKPAEEFYDLAQDPHAVAPQTPGTADGPDAARLRAALVDHWDNGTDSGLVPERELISRGMLEDSLTGYAASAGDLPPAQRIGGVSSVLEDPEAEMR